jgi:hypothetical protein
VLTRTIVVNRRGLQSCETTLTVFVVWPPPCTSGNKVCGISARSLTMKTVASDTGEVARRHNGDPLVCGKGPRLSSELSDREFGLCEGLQQGLGRSSRVSRYPRKNTGVIDKSLYLYLIFCFRIYIVILVVCFTFPSLIS